MAKYWRSSVPSKSKEFQHQLQIDSVNDEQFESLGRPLRYSARQILYQTICFFIFLGPLRLLFNVIVFVFVSTAIICVRWLVRTLHLPASTGRATCISFARFGIRSVMFGFGIFYVKTDGNVDQLSRFVIANHVGLLDAFLIFIFRDFTFPIDAKYSLIGPLNLLIDFVDPIYVEGRRSKEKVLAAVDDFSTPPVLIFPEGLGSRGCGDVLLKFDRTAFSTPYRVQPVTIGYHMFGVPKDWNTFAYRGEYTLSTIWRLISMPPAALSLHFLPAMSMEQDGKSDIEMFMSIAQLTMANYIGIKAIDREDGKKKKKD